MNYYRHTKRMACNNAICVKFKLVFLLNPNKTQNIHQTRTDVNSLESAKYYFVNFFLVQLSSVVFHFDAMQKVSPGWISRKVFGVKTS